MKAIARLFADMGDSYVELIASGICFYHPLEPSLSLLYWFCCLCCIVFLLLNPHGALQFEASNVSFGRSNKKSSFYCDLSPPQFFIIAIFFSRFWGSDDDSECIVRSCFTPGK